MSLWSVLRGAAAQVIPGGKTYGSYNPPKKRPDQPTVTQAPTVQPVNLSNNIPTNRTPISFGTLRPTNTVSVPTQQTNKSPYGFWQKAGDFLGGISSGISTAPVGVARAGTGAVEGLDQIPALVVKGANAATNRVTGNTGHWGITNTVDNSTNAVNRVSLDPVNRALDTTAKFIATHRPIGDKEINASAGQTGYKGAQIGANVIAMATGAGELADAAAASRLAQGTKAATLLSRTGRQLAPAENAGVLSRVTTPLYNAAHYTINAPIRGAKRLISRSTPVEDVGTGANIVNETGSTPVQIPVSQPTDIPVSAPEALPQPVNVRTVPKPLIKEVTGDASTADSAAQKLADQKTQQLHDRFDSQDQPTKTISDVTPRTQTPYKLSSDVVAANQEKIISDYADMLKNMGEGNGVAITSDGRRVSNNVRSAANKGKKMTKADWQAEAESQLTSGKAEPGHQQAFNDASNPDVQSQLNSEPAPANGTPIRVKQVNPIDVNSVENVPANLPEAPGKVRVTTQTAPVQAQSEAIAAQTPPAPVEPPSGVAQTTTDTVPKTVDATAPSDPFYQGLAEDLVGNIKQAAKSNKELKAIVSAQKGKRVGAATGAANDVSGEAKLRAFFGNLKGKYADNTGYVGSNHSQDVVDRVINDAMNEADQLGFSRGNTAQAFQKVFRAGQTVDGHTITAPTKSDIRLVKEFLNRKVGGSIGDNLDSEYAKLLADAPKKEDFGFLSNLTGLPRVLMTSGDLSVSGRQALKLGLQHPIEFAKANTRAIKYALNPKSYNQAITNLQNSDIANFVQDNMKVKLPMLAHTDDAYWGDAWANKIPGVNKFVQASERQYNAVLSDMRLASATKQINKAGGLDEFQNVIFNKAGGDYEKFNKALGKWGDVINNLSGSGDIGGIIAKNPGLASTLFAPRNLAAKFNTFNPVWYAQIAKSNPAAAIYAAKSMGTYLATVGGTLLALKQAGASVELDPRSADFGVIKLGNTRLDLTGGDRTVATFIARMSLGIGKLADGNLPGDAKNVNTGAITSKTPQSIVGQFLSNKLSPVAGLVNNMLGFKPNKDGTGITDAYGNPLNTNSVWATLGNLTVPMTAQDVASAYSDSGSVAKAAGVGVASFLGAGANTYGTTKTKDQPAANEKVAGAFSDVQSDNVRNLLTADEQKLYDQSFGKDAFKMASADTNKLNLAIKQTAGKLLENSDYQHHAAVIQHQIGLLEQDPSTTDATIAPLQTQVNRDKVLQQYNVPYSDLKLYEKTSQSTWASMGRQYDSNGTPNDAYDPATYQKLAALDDALAKGSGSAVKDDPTKNKYNPKGAGTGYGSSSKVKGIETSFGTLSGSSSAPKVREYQTANISGNGGIPVIQAINPSIVHKIGTG